MPTIHAHSFTDAERRGLLAAWATARRTGTTQAAFCASHGIAPRTLRSWSRLFGPVPGQAIDLHDVRAELQVVAARLGQVLEALEAHAAPEAASADCLLSPRRDVEEERPSDLGPRSADTVGPGTETAAPPAAAEAPTGTPSFSWDDWD